MLNFPQEILRHIFQFDSTYKDIFTNNVLNNVHMHVWRFWKKRFLKQICELNVEPDVEERFEILLTYLLESWQINCQWSDDFRKLYPSDIIILSDYRNLMYSNGTLVTSFTREHRPFLVTVHLNARKSMTRVRTKLESVYHYKNQRTSREALVYKSHSYLVHEIYDFPLRMLDGVIFPPFDE